MKLKLSLLLIIFVFLIMGCAGVKEKTVVEPPQKEIWRAVHLLNYKTGQDLEELGKLIPQLAEMGLNVIVLEVDYNFDFQSHPELRSPGQVMTKEDARRLVKICETHGIRLIPEFQCVAHQSWEEETFPLLIKYPHFDLTPGAFPDNKGIYCREWDVTNPEVYKIVFKLMDEIIDAFEADAFHVGMDEVFLLGAEESPSTKGKDPGELFAEAVNDIYGHLVKKRGIAGGFR
ncbi:MAG: family 20 glycosylhydrolase [bacterium]|nr:family 20 glycosylhydrolase [bacterium]